MAGLAVGCTAPVSPLPSPSATPVAKSEASVALRPFVAEPLNQLPNPGFEEDWFHESFAQNRRFLLLQSSDVGVAAPDGIPDHWSVASTCWDSTVRRSGQRSLHFRGPGRASQRWRWVGENGWQVGGARYGGFVPMVASLATRVKLRPLTVGVWCRGQGEARLSVQVHTQQRPKADEEAGGTAGSWSRQVAFDPGQHDWQVRQIEISPQDLTGTPYFLTVTLEGGAGEVWFDDVEVHEKMAADEVNLVPNGDFEVNGGWSAPQLWKWWRNQYYVWTGWSHEGDKRWRGGVHYDPFVHFDGQASLRFDVLPGDEFAVASQPIPLGQKTALPLEARAYVRADQIRGLEIMAQDEKGQWLPQGDFLGDDMENTPSMYNMGTTGSGTYDWICVRKYFSPRKPVQSVRLFLCARGFDGQRVARNLVGTVWWDDVQLYQHGQAAPAPAASLAGEPARGLTGRHTLDLGERLWGANQLRLPPGQSWEWELRAPDGSVQKGKSEGSAVYRLTRLCRDAGEQYRLQLRCGGLQAQYFFGTPAAALELVSNALYAYPEEKIQIYGRLNLSSPELAKARLELSDAGSKQVLQKFDGDLASLRRQVLSPGEFYDARNCLQWLLSSQGQKVHPWSEPTRDLRLEARLLDGQGQQLARSGQLAVGFLERIPAPVFPSQIQSSRVDERHRLLLNGKPYLPVYWTPNFDRPHEGNYPPRLWGYPSLDLNNVAAGGEAAALQQARANPKFFAYELGEGEMQLQGAGWPLRLKAVAGLASKIRAQDSQHLINGPESWLIGHPGHNQALGAFTSIFDVVGVETSFEEVPEADRYRGSSRPCAVLAGLEAYYYQPVESLRWRGYRALYEGCSGVGLCPSEMLKASPAHINALRGLNGEFRGLEAVLLGTPEKSVQAEGQVQVFQRQFQGRHYLFAMSAPGAKSFPMTASFRGLNGRVKVRGEGRTLESSGGRLQDVFQDRYTVHVYEY